MSLPGGKQRGSVDVAEYPQGIPHNTAESVPTSKEMDTPRQPVPVKASYIRHKGTRLDRVTVIRARLPRTINMLVCMCS